MKLNKIPAVKIQMSDQRRQISNVRSTTSELDCQIAAVRSELSDRRRRRGSSQALSLFQSHVETIYRTALRVVTDVYT